MEAGGDDGDASSVGWAAHAPMAKCSRGHVGRFRLIQVLNERIVLSDADEQVPNHHDDHK